MASYCCHPPKQNCKLCCCNLWETAQAYQAGTTKSEAMQTWKWLNDNKLTFAATHGSESVMAIVTAALP